MSYDLVGVGNPVYDIIVTPRTRTNGRVLSGCSTNACLAAKKLGVKKVGMVGTVGRDYAKSFAQDMEGYDIEAKAIDSGGETGGFHLIYDEKGNRTLDVLGVASRISPKDFPTEFLDSKFILIGPILGEVDVNLIEHLSRASTATIFLDPQGLLRNIGPDRRIQHTCNKPVFKEICQLVDFVKPNELEFETITAQKDPVLALRELRSFPTRFPIVTLAERGSMLQSDGQLLRVPAFPTEAVDPTGAVDVYAGSFITEYLRTADIAESALFASAAASIKVEQVGPDFHLDLNNVNRRKKAIRSRLTAEPCQS